ncbi:sensor histidine kinase [Nakamurella lactea]|uniref:sensor histidine kinase n=1 Tax=Nakamurella lactea TaxID=459515 RepID=UPI0004023902|nr:sensor histidine kinase [Nakamurella lactea]
MRATPASAPPLSVPVALRLAMHLLVGALLIVAVVREQARPLVVGLALLVAVVYAVGPLTPAIERRRRNAAWWLAALLLAWLGLLIVTPDAIWLAFPWFFLLMHLLPLWPGLVSVAVVAGLAIGGFAWHQVSFTVGMVIGPVIGAAVAVAAVLAFQALHAESERRRELIAELESTRAELAAAERQSGVLGERERLAREIHDTLAQGLSSIQLLLSAAGRTLADPRADRPALERAAGHVELARRSAADNLAEARRFVRALAPAELQGRPLAEALDRLCRTVSAESGIAVRFDSTGGAGSIPTPVEVALLRIAQSALGNAVQHAAPSAVRVTLSRLDSVVALDIVDDGTGFDPSTAAPTPNDSGGFGLASMRSRAAELGGTLTVESTPGTGTAVAATFGIGDGHDLD